jgi:hypothetical protein
MGDKNAKVSRETVHQPTIDKHSVHERTNENGLRLVDFAVGRQMAIKSTYFMHKRHHLQTWHSPDGHTFNQFDQCLIDGRHFSDAADRLKDRYVAALCYDELESELQGVQAQPLSLDEKCKKLEETIERVATNTIGYTRKQANKEWFDKECAKVNDEKNAARERTIQI